MKPLSIPSRLLVTLLVTAGLTAGGALAESPDTSPDTEVEALLKQLDSGNYREREEATQILRERVLDLPANAPLLEAVGQQLSDDSHSLDRQLRVKSILNGIAVQDASRPKIVEPEEVENLIDLLVSEKYSVRIAALHRLDHVLTEQRNIVPIWLALKARIQASDASASLKAELLPFSDFLRKRWLEAAEENCILPPVRDDQIQSWIQAIAKPAEDEKQFAAQQTAVQELQDLFARSDYLQKTKLALEAELNRVSDPACAQQLKDLLELIPPAMVAEIWTLDHHESFGGGFSVERARPSLYLSTWQFLQIGMPQLPDHCSKVTHFDYCDDKKAYCVSGNTLQRGEYPVRAAIFHPGVRVPMVFQFINLPNPRRRLLYEYSINRPGTIQFHELSTNACEALLTGRKKFSEADSRLLGLLDANVVSAFAGEYLAKVNDRRLNGKGDQIPVGLPSAHGGVCYALACNGTKAAAPGIIAAIAKDRILPPDVRCAYDLPRIALLAIAIRDPWKGVDDWLIDQLDYDLPLISNVDPAPDLAATAAAILCERRKLTPHSFNLQAVEEMFCESIGVQLYRMSDAADREAVRKVIRAQFGPRQRVSAG